MKSRKCYMFSWFLLQFLRICSARSVAVEDSVSIVPNYSLSTVATTNSVSSYNGRSNQFRNARGMQMYNEQEKSDKDIEENRAVKNDPWAGYYDFLINEGSFKFWAAFQLATAILLIYSAFAAVYYAKFNPISSDYDYYDDFLFRSNGRSSGSEEAPSWLDNINKSTFQRIIDAISSNKYSKTT